MGLAEMNYVVLPEAGFTRPDTEKWPEIVRRWLVQCPNCSEIRLVVGARENERYVCKDCGHGFIIRPPVAECDSVSAEGSSP